MLDVVQLRRVRSIVQKYLRTLGNGSHGYKVQGRYSVVRVRKQIGGHSVRVPVNELPNALRLCHVFFGFENRRAMHCTFLRLWLWFAMAALPHGCCGNNRPTPAALLASVHDGVFDALHHVWRCGEAFVVSIQAPGVRCDDIAGFKLVRREQTTAPLTVLYADTKDGVRMRWAVRGQHRLFQTSLRSARMDLQSGSPPDGRSLLVPVCSQNGMGVHLFVNWVTVEVC